MKPTILITSEFTHDAEAELLNLGYQVERAGWGVTRHIMSEVEYIKTLQRTTASIAITELEHVSRSVFDACPTLRIVATCRGDPVNVDVATATQRGIPVLYTPGRNTVAVADFTIALLLAIVREIPQADAHLRANTWHINGDLPYFYFRGPELEGKTLGLVGCGAIGRLVAQRARGFGMDVVIFDPYLSPDRIGDVGRLVVLDTLLLRADVVSIHCPLNAETSGLINQAAIAKMKPTAYLINTARAAVVDEDGLYCALSEQRLAGAALDVFWQEPLAPDSRWRNLRNVVLTPHIAGASRDVVCRHSQMIVADLKRLAGGECPAHIANPDILSVGRN